MPNVCFKGYKISEEKSQNFLPSESAEILSNVIVCNMHNFCLIS